MKAGRFLKPEEIERINDSIAEAERHTSAEIVPVVVSQSSDYREVAYLGGVIGALVTYVAAIYVMVIDKPSTTLLTLAVGYIAGALLSRIPAVARGLIGERFAEEETWRRAALEFQLNHVHRTTARTGVVLLISLLEHRVVVYADQAIAEKLKDETWAEVRDLVINGLKSRRRAEGLVAGIRKCGEVLSAPFPIQSGDVNELPNRIVIRD